MLATFEWSAKSVVFSYASAGKIIFFIYLFLEGKLYPKIHFFGCHLETAGPNQLGKKTWFLGRSGHTHNKLE